MRKHNRGREDQNDPGWFMNQILSSRGKLLRCNKRKTEEGLKNVISGRN